MYKNIHIWLGSYLKQRLAQWFAAAKVVRPTHVIFCFVDHFEPDWHSADASLQLRRVKNWIEQYPLLAQRHRDHDGCFPKHSFFYPAEVYVQEHLDALAGLCRQGFGEVEIHLHHDGDTPETLRQKLEKAKADFSRHGLLGRDKSGRVRYGFIHGNWCLNNSRRDGKWCGVNDESRILLETGCYADFTFPSAPSETQPAQINSIYYDEGDATRPKSHNHGPQVAVNRDGSPRLMIVQGPLALDLRARAHARAHARKWGIIPRVENADVTGVNPLTPGRIDLLVEQRIRVLHRDDWVFVKVHTHGAPERNADSLLGDPLDAAFMYLEKKYNDGRDFVLHYVSAREMFNIIKAAEAGLCGNPGQYRDYLISLNR